MADDKLREQYETLTTAFTRVDSPSPELLAAAVCHILARLGPPEPLDGVDAEKLTDASD